MIKDTSQMRGRDIWPLVHAGQIKLGGYRNRKIYGRLDCKSAIRHLKNGTYQKSRVLFASEAEAIQEGYRPCAKCLPKHYAKWKECQAKDEEYSIEVAGSINEQVEWL